MTNVRRVRAGFGWFALAFVDVGFVVIGWLEGRYFEIEHWDKLPSEFKCRLGLKRGSVLK